MRNMADGTTTYEEAAAVGGRGVASNHFNDTHHSQLAKNIESDSA